MVKAFANMAGEQGMDLRDYFAAAAMQGMMRLLKNAEIGVEDDGTPTEDSIGLAHAAYGVADAMMKAREGE
jgi:hypothetical protein